MKKGLINLTLYLLPSLLYISCIQQEHVSKQFRVLLNKGKTDTIFYSQFVDSISYIDLSIPDTCIISDFSDMVMSDNQIFILDSQQKCIWSFDSHGNLTRCLNRRGHGYGEYAFLSQFEYDYKAQELLVLDGPSQTILHYNGDGTFITKEEIDVCASDFKIAGKNYLISNLGYPKIVAGIYIFDRQNKKSKKILSKEDDFRWNNIWEMSSWGDTIGIMSPPLNNRLFHFKSGFAIDTIDISVPLSGEHYDYTEDVSKYQDYQRTIQSESDRWLYLTFWKYKSTLQSVVINKINDTILEGSLLYNDIDGINPSYHLSYCEGNVFSKIVLGHQPKGYSIQFLHLKQ